MNLHECLQDLREKAEQKVVPPRGNVKNTSAGENLKSFSRWAALLDEILDLEDAVGKMIARRQLNWGSLLRVYTALREIRARWLQAFESDLWERSGKSNEELDENGLDPAARGLYDKERAHLSELFKKAKLALAMAS